MEYCVTKRTGLLKNRHLDQVQVHVMIFKYTRSYKVEKKVEKKLYEILNPQTGNIIHTLRVFVHLHVLMFIFFSS